MAAQYSCSSYTKHSFKGVRDKNSLNPKLELANKEMVPEMKLKLKILERSIKDLEHLCIQTIKHNHTHTQWLSDHAMSAWCDKYSNEIEEYLAQIRKLSGEKEELYYKIQDYDIPPTRIVALRQQIQEKEMKKVTKTEKKKKEKEKEKEKVVDAFITDSNLVPDSWEDLV